MKLIVAGLPKTGTKSLAKSLQMLGYKVFDTKDNYNHFHQKWTRIMNHGGVPVDFRDMYAHVDATTDVPAVYYWEEMLKAFPDTKVILMLRDDEQQWCKSMIHQLMMLAECGLFSFATILSPSCKKFQKFINDALRLTFGVEPIQPGKVYYPNAQALKIAYRNHNARVLKVTPKDQLLVFNCREGWTPLCKFLNCPVPDIQFPHENKRAELVKEEVMSKDPAYQQIWYEIVLRISVIIFGVLGLFGLLLYVLLR